MRSISFLNVTLLGPFGLLQIHPYDNSLKMQEAFSFALPLNSSDEPIYRVMTTTLWFLWRARNDLRFNKKTWSVCRLCFEVATDLAASSWSVSKKKKLRQLLSIW